MTRIKAAFILLLCLPAICYISCTQERDPCLQPKIMLLKIGAYQRVDTSIVDTALPHPFIAAIDFNDSIKVVNDGSAATNKFSVYLSPLADSARWLIWPDSSLSVNTADTITFYYDKSLTFLSNACGYTYFYNLHGMHTTNHSIDSAVISSYSVNDDASKEHLKIYY